MDNKLWENIGETVYKVSRLQKQIPELKKSISMAREKPVLAAGAVALAGLAEAKVPYADTLMGIVKAQKIPLPWEGITVGKYNAKTTASYNRHIGGLEYKKKPAYGIQLTKRF